MQRPEITGWGVTTNENGVVIASINRDQLVETIKYTDALEARVKSLEALCAIGGIPDNIVAVFSKVEVTEEDRQWARDKIKNIPPNTITRT